MPGHLIVARKIVSFFQNAPADNLPDISVISELLEDIDSFVFHDIECIAPKMASDIFIALHNAMLKIDQGKQRWQGIMKSLVTWGCTNTLQVLNHTLDASSREERHLLLEHLSQDMIIDRAAPRIVSQPLWQELITALHRDIKRSTNKNVILRTKIIFKLLDSSPENLFLLHARLSSEHWDQLHKLIKIANETTIIEENIPALISHAMPVFNELLHYRLFFGDLSKPERNAMRVYEFSHWRAIERMLNYVFSCTDNTIVLRVHSIFTTMIKYIHYDNDCYLPSSRRPSSSEIQNRKKDLAFTFFYYLHHLIEKNILTELDKTLCAQLKKLFSTELKGWLNNIAKNEPVLFRKIAAKQCAFARLIDEHQSSTFTFFTPTERGETATRKLVGKLLEIQKNGMEEELADHRQAKPSR